MATTRQIPEPESFQRIYHLVRTAVIRRHPISATYHGLYRKFCPHRLGSNKSGEPRVLCYQYGGESERGLQPAGSPENWRCIALDKLTDVQLLKEPWRTAPNHTRPQTCVAEVDVDAEDFKESR